MKNFIITLGQQHVHEIRGRVIGHNHLIQIQAKDLKDARTIAFDLFNGEFHRVLPSEEVDKEFQKFFPAGIVIV